MLCPRDACYPRRARHHCVTDSVRSKLHPLYVPVIPVVRAERSKPCPVALVPTLACSRPPAKNLNLLRPAIQVRTKVPEYIIFLKSKRSLHWSSTSSYPARYDAPSYPDAFPRVSTSTGPRGGREPVFLCLYPCSPTHGEIRGRTGRGLRARESHANRK